MESKFKNKIRKELIVWGGYKLSAKKIRLCIDNSNRCLNTIAISIDITI